MDERECFLNGWLGLIRSFCLIGGSRGEKVFGSIDRQDSPSSDQD